MTGRRYAPAHLQGVIHTGHDCGYPVADLQPGKGRIVNLGIHPDTVPYLGPEPLRGVGISDLVEVLRPSLPADPRDLLSLEMSGVVLPEPDQGVFIIFKTFYMRKGRIVP